MYLTWQSDVYNCEACLCLENGEVGLATTISLCSPWDILRCSHVLFIHFLLFDPLSPYGDHAWSVGVVGSSSAAASQVGLTCTLKLSQEHTIEEQNSMKEVLQREMWIRLWSCLGDDGPIWAPPQLFEAVLINSLVGWAVVVSPICGRGPWMWQDSAQSIRRVLFGFELFESWRSLATWSPDWRRVRCHVAWQ